MWKKTVESDWFFMSMCSAHLEMKHQWADGVGVEDNLHLTTEEWAYYELDKEFVGLSAHVLDLSSKTLYATAAFTNGGFEKIAEINVRADVLCMIVLSALVTLSISIISHTIRFFSPNILITLCLPSLDTMEPSTTMKSSQTKISIQITSRR
jgi:hypothetical protein